MIVLSICRLCSHGGPGARREWLCAPARTAAGSGGRRRLRSCSRRVRCSGCINASTYANARDAFAEQGCTREEKHCKPNAQAALHAARAACRPAQLVQMPLSVFSSRLQSTPVCFRAAVPKPVPVPVPISFVPVVRTVTIRQ